MFTPQKNIIAIARPLPVGGSHILSVHFQDKQGSTCVASIVIIEIVHHTKFMAVATALALVTKATDGDYSLLL